MILILSIELGLLDICNKYEAQLSDFGQQVERIVASRTFAGKCHKVNWNTFHREATL